VSVPTLKGLADNTPAHTTFELASTAQEHTKPMPDELIGVVAGNYLVWANERPLERIGEEVNGGLPGAATS
jgi:hypothetical protein